MHIDDSLSDKKFVECICLNNMKFDAKLIYKVNIFIFFWKIS